MRRFVNGIEVELEAADVAIVECDGRMIVRSSEGAHSAVAILDGSAVHVSFRGRQFRIERAAAKTRRRSSLGETGEIFAPMPGQIVDVLVQKGDSVAHRQKIVVLEAMKTQQAFVAPFDGVVASLDAAVGAQVQEGDLLALIEPSAEEG